MAAGWGEQRAGEDSGQEEKASVRPLRECRTPRTTIQTIGRTFRGIVPRFTAHGKTSARPVDFGGCFSAVNDHLEQQNMFGARLSKRRPSGDGMVTHTATGMCLTTGPVDVYDVDELLGVPATKPNAL